MNKLVQELRDNGFRVRIWHGRFAKGKENPIYGEPVQNYLRSKREILAGGQEVSQWGGATGVRIFDPETDELLAEGWALCRVNDKFNPRLGITIAAGRASKALGESS